jgi:signal transduction protein with GAF and PtsI domain
MRRRQDLIESFAAKAQNLAGTAAARALHELVLSTGLELVGGDSGSLMLASIAERQLTIVAARGLAEDVVRTSRIQFGDRIAGLVAETRRPLLLGSGPTPAAIAPRMERQHELSSSLCVPLLSEGSAIGVLSVNRRHDRMPFTADDLESMGQLARSAEGQLASLLSKPPSTANDRE